jgi:GT2 family glycosyltransferase
MMKTKVAVIIPNWNGADHIEDCLIAVKDQTVGCHTVVVDNGSIDGSLVLLRKKFSWVHVIKHRENRGFAGGVNSGIKYAIENKYEYIALLNSDAVLDKKWLEHLVLALESNAKVGAVMGKILGENGESIDSTGDEYTSWGLSSARQRDEKASSAVSEGGYVFGASAGAALYRAGVFRGVGLFDEKFFAYYEDTDLNFRLQLKGWKSFYVPSAVAYHATGTTSRKIAGFTTYQTMKNLPMLFWKNVPLKHIPHIFPRLFFAYWTIMIKQILFGNRWAAIKGQAAWLKNIPHTFRERSRIQKSKKVSDEYIWSILTHDLPPNAANLRRLRSFLKLESLRK